MKTLCMRAAILAALAIPPSLLAQPYFPSMVYGTKTTIAPGVTWQYVTNASPLYKIHVIEIDMANRNVELVPVFKSTGNVDAAANETTSLMAVRADAVAAVNAGYYKTTSPGLRMTNSYTEIDGVFIGGSGDLLRAESGRSMLGFSGDHQSLARRFKLTNATPTVPSSAGDTTDWARIVDAMAGRGHFVTAAGSVVTVDNEGTTAAHYDDVHPRTMIGYSLTPTYRAFLVTVDGRQTGVAVGMTYATVGQLMADLGIEQSISLDGGGSTTAWIKGQGVVNSPSDGSERAVVSAWAVVRSNTMDNTVSEVSTTGTWATDTTHAQKYYTDQFVSDNTAGASTATWTPDLGEAGLYKVYGWWTAEAGRATAVPYAVNHLNGIANLTVNQTANGGKWNLLGLWYFDAGTAGSVTLSNAATGTVSADAVRFVRIADLPPTIDPGYTVTGTVYETGFETNQSSMFTLAHMASAGDNSANFTYNYSTFAQAAGGHPTSIPASPGTTDSDRTALRLATNISNGVLNSITATLTGIAAQGNMRITFDAWQNYNGGAGGGAGSTEFLNFGATTNAATPVNISSNYLSGTNGAYSGWFFSLSGEGGSNQDLRYYDANGGAARGNNGARANYLGTAAIDNLQATGMFPVGQYESLGGPGKAWNRWEAISLNGQLRLLVTKPDGSTHILCDWFTPNTGTPTTGVRPMFGLADTFAGSASPASDSFILIDNLKVETIAPITSVGDWMLY